MTIEKPAIGRDKAADTKPLWWQEPLRIFMSLSGWVLVPLVAGYTVGRWLDTKYHSSPRWFLVSVGVSFVISVAGMIRQARIEYKKFDPPKK